VLSFLHLTLPLLKKNVGVLSNPVTCTHKLMNSFFQEFLHGTVRR
jgi:hypothetical protein